MLKKGLRNH